MKLIKDRLLAGCGIAVIILFCFFLFISFDSGITFQLTFSSFLIIFGISLLISAASLIFKLDSFPYFVRLCLHFFTLLAVIFGLLGSTGVLKGKSATQYFLLIVGYLFFYALITVVLFGWKKLYAYIIKTYFPSALTNAGKTSAKGAPKAAENKKPGQKSKKDGEKSSYKPLYK